MHTCEKCKNLDPFPPFAHTMLLTDATAFGSARFGQGRGPIVMDDVRCSGQETSIMNCTFSSNHNCAHSEDAGIRCQSIVNTSKCMDCTVAIATFVRHESAWCKGRCTLRKVLRVS